MFWKEGDEILQLQHVDTQEINMHTPAGSKKAIALRIRTTSDGEPAAFPPLWVSAQDLLELAEVLRKRAQGALDAPSTPLN